MIDTFLDFMHRGGPVMWVILLAAIVALAMLVWQAIQITVQMRYVNYEYRKLRSEAAYFPDWEQPTRSNPITQLLDKVNWENVRTPEDLFRELNLHYGEILPKLEGMLPTVATLATLLPMLGLLGTVTGMINVFDVIAVNGTGNPNEMASGISQALFTTAGGLIMAIPVIFIHHLLARRLGVVLVVVTQTMQILVQRDLPKLADGAAT